MSNIKIAIAVVLLIGLGFWAGYLVPKKIATGTVVPVSQNIIDNKSIESNINSSSDKIIDEYTHADYRIVKLFDSPYYPNVIYIATEKSDAKCGSASAPERCSDDSVCGSIYSSPTCFFFTEPKFDVKANMVSHYIGSLSKEGSLLFDTLNIKDNILYFTTADGETGGGFTKKWKLDLATGVFTLLENIVRQGFTPQ